MEKVNYQELLTKRMKEIIAELQKTAPKGYRVAQQGFKWSANGWWVLETVIQSETDWKDVKYYMEVEV